MRATHIARRRERTKRSTRATRRVALGVGILGLLLALLLAPVAAAALGATGLLAYVRALPDVDALRDLPARFQPSPATTRLYARDAPDGDGQRRPVLLHEMADPRAGGAGWARPAELPRSVLDAIIAVEDPDFLTAPAPDLGRALLDWARAGAIRQSHSPIIRALVDTHLRNGTPAAPDDSRRALGDWLLGWQVSRRFSRGQLLEWTLNTRYYGHLAYGIEGAARLYFGKGAVELTTGEAALLAAVARDPAINPFDQPDAARAGQAVVLDAMAQQGMLSADEAARAAAESLAFALPPWANAAAPGFVRLARRELEAILGPERLARGGWQVETTLDLVLQEQAACLAAGMTQTAMDAGGSACPARGHLTLPEDADTPTSLAVVALDPATGAIEALVGVADELAAHPAGTLARPFIYLTALSQGYTAASQTLDVESIYLQAGRPYSPRNIDGDYLGPLRLREALAAGQAAPAVQVLSWVGVGRVAETMRALGLEPGAETPADLTFAERGFPAGLLEVGHAFATVGNAGARAGVALDGAAPRPATIRQVFDAQGQEVYAFTPATQETLAPELAFLLTDMLASDEAALPDGRRAALAAGQSPDGAGWAIGYTPERLVGVWANRASVAEPVWQALMTWSLAGQPATEWPRPVGLRQVAVCKLSGLLPQRDGATCPTVNEWFVPGTEPAATDTMQREVAVNRGTGRLATIFTPPQLIERQPFVVYPDEAARWAADRGLTGPPTEYDTIYRTPARAGGAAVTSPEPWAAISGQWSVDGSAGGDSFSYYRLAYFPGLLPEAMQVIVERAETPVEAGELGVWDTTLLDDGLYTLLLTVVRADGTFDEVGIPVTVANGE